MLEDIISLLDRAEHSNCLLNNTFEIIEHKYSSIKNNLKEQVEKWLWADYLLHEPLPFHFQRNHRKRGKIININESNSRYDLYNYGLDENERPIILIRTTEYENQNYEELFLYKDSATEYVLSFDCVEPKRLISFTRKTFCDNKLTTVEIFWAERCLRENYIYQNDKITSINEDKFNFSQEYPKQSTWNIYYDYNNEVYKIISSYYGEVFQKSYSINMIQKSVINKLLEAVPDMIKKLKITQPVFSISICLVEEAFELFPPIISIVTKSDIDEAIKEDLVIDDYLWNPYNFHTYHIYDNEFYKCEDLSINEACQMLNQHIETEEDYDLACETLLKLSKKLTNYQWNKILNVVPEFLVYAYWDECDLEDNIIYSSGQNKLKKLKESGYFS